MTAVETTGIGAGGAVSVDPLDDGDPRRVAEHAHLEALLRCWLTESDVRVEPGPLRVELPTTRLALVADVVHASPTGWHRFGPVRLERSDRGERSDGGSADRGEVVAERADPVLSAGLLAAEVGARPGGVPPGETADLVERTAESVRHVAAFVADRWAEMPADRHRDGFLDAEQALLLGHLNHPTPKSRGGISAHERAAWSPEMRGAFALHWFAADPSVVSAGATDAGTDVAALLADLAGPKAPRDGRVLVPAHPWQARDLLHRPRVAALVADGLLEPLGPLGDAWSATSSVRTVYRSDVPVMLKLSLGLQLTNSKREAMRVELRRGVEVDRLLRGGLADATFAAHPGFSITRDPAWLAVDTPGAPGGPAVTGLDVSVREVPEGASGLRCLAGLVAPRPGPGRSLLGVIVDGPGAAADWIASYTDHVLVPMLHLHASSGIGVEGHQQNTLVRLRSDGRPVGASFRDNQGFYLPASRHADVCARLGVEESALAVVDDALVDDRLSYYLLRNQALAPIGCLGAEGRADERDLLGVLAERLEAALPGLAAAGPDGDRLARRWLTADTLPMKANMMTRLHGMDELLAPLDAQSVYLDLANPLRRARR